MVQENDKIKAFRVIATRDFHGSLLITLKPNTTYKLIQGHIFSTGLTLLTQSANLFPAIEPLIAHKNSAGFTVITRFTFLQTKHINLLNYFS